MEKRRLWQEMTLFKCLRDWHINKALNYLAPAALERRGKIRGQELQGGSFPLPLRKDFLNRIGRW